MDIIFLINFLKIFTFKNKINIDNKETTNETFKVIEEKNNEDKNEEIDIINVGNSFIFLN